MSKITISLDRCPIHNYRAISVNSSDGFGTRLTASKCCGRWDTEHEFRVTPEQLRDMAETLLEYAEEKQP